jgi:hypothetical protein
MSKPLFKDFDAVIKQQRTARLAGEEIDVSLIPSRVMVELLEMMGSKDLENVENFFNVMELVSKVCQVSNKKITVDWLYDNTDLDTLLDFAEYVIQPAKERVTGKTDSGESKN